MESLNSSKYNQTLPTNAEMNFPWYEEPKGSITFRLTVFGFVIFSSLIGNSIVVKAIHDRSYLRKPFVYFVVTNLAAAELVGTICLPFFQAYDDLKTWHFGDTMCRVLNAFMLTSFFVVPWSLATIAFLRFRIFSKRQIFLLSGKRILLFIFFVWFLGALVSVPSYIFSVQVKSVYDNHSYWCIELFPEDTLETFPSDSLKRYYFIRFVLNFVLPGIIVVVAYGGVVIKLKRHLIASSQRNHPNDDCEPQTMTTINTSTPDSLGHAVSSNMGPVETDSTEHSRQESKTSSEHLKEIEIDLLRMIYIVILIYIGCYIPYQVFFLVEHFGYSIVISWRYYFIARKYAYLLTCCPSALHPVCYGTMNKFYAQVFSRLILCKNGALNP